MLVLLSFFGPGARLAQVLMVYVTISPTLYCLQVIISILSVITSNKYKNDVIMKSSGFVTPAFQHLL